MKPALQVDVRELLDSLQHDGHVGRDAMFVILLRLRCGNYSPGPEDVRDVANIVDRYLQHVEPLEP